MYMWNRAFQDCGKTKIGGQIRRDILHAVDRQIHLAPKKRFLDLFYKKSLSADVRQRNIQDFITLCLNSHQLHPEGGKAFL